MWWNNDSNEIVEMGNEELWDSNETIVMDSNSDYSNYLIGNNHNSNIDINRNLLLVKWR
jgi:hypothetical protein